MAVTCVKLSADAYMVCLTHALSTEKEEIMGLLIGEIDERRQCCVSAIIMLRRSDKQADRVEISPEQLSDASSHAERLAAELGRPMRVVGWYHSHPHITVWPSHVDVETQAMYQLMDEGFVGVIFSVFNHDKTSKNNRIEVTCFQSVNQSPEGQPAQNTRLEVPLHIVPTNSIAKPCMESLVQLPKILSQEEEEVYEKTKQVVDMDLVTKLHNGAVFTKSLCHMMDVMSAPLMQCLEQRLQQNAHRIRFLQHRHAQLQDMQEAQAEHATPPTSPVKQTSV